MSAGRSPVKNTSGLDICEKKELGFFVFLTRSTGDWNYWKYESMPLRGGPQRAPEPCKHIIGAYQSN